MANNTKNTTITFNKKTIALIVSLVGVLLLFIGLFGATLKVGVKSGIFYAEESIGLKYIFKDGFKAITDGDLSAGFKKFILVLSILSFFGGVLGILGIVGYNAYLIYSKKEIKFGKSIALILVAAMQYSFFMRATNFVSGQATILDESGTLSMHLGWGSILIVIGFFISLVALLIHESDEGKAFAHSNITIKIGVLIIFFISIFGITTLVNSLLQDTMGELGGEKISSNINIFDWMESVIAAKESGIEKYGTIKALGVISLIFAFISLIAFGYTMYQFIKGDVEKDSKKLIGSSIAYTGSALIANGLFMASVIVSNNAEKQTNEIIQNTNPGFSAIVSLVLGVLLIVAAVVAVKLNGKTLKYTKSK